QLAWVENEHAKRAKEVPAALFKQLHRSMTKTLMLLENLEEYSGWRDICFGMYVSSDGTAIAVSTKELFDGKLTLPRNPPPRQGIPKSGPDDMHVGVNVKAALRDIRETIERCAPKAKQGQPEKVDRAACVHFAKKFFVAYSRHKASTDPKNPFAEFCEHFYRAVHGKTVKTDSLAWFIRAALKNAQGLRWSTQLHDLKV